MDTFRKILDDVDEVDLTPMIDVTFLLLIYFMVTTMIKQPEAELSAILPGKSAPSSHQKTKPESHIEIEADGSVRVDGNYMGNAIDTMELPDVLEYLRGEKSKHGEDFVVHIWADPLATWQAPLSALNACGAAGIKNVSPNMRNK